MGIHHLYVLWMVIISVNVCAGVELLQRHVGESVVLRCSVLPDHGNISTYGVRLKRCWLRQDQVLFMHEHSQPFVSNPVDNTRISVSGDPSIQQVNLTISDLRASDTDRYCCEFVVEATPEDRIIPGKVEFFIYVANDDPSLAIVHVETCAGGSAVLPCTHPLGEDRQAAVEGFSLKRQKSSGPVEVLYHSKYHHHHLVSSTAMLPSSSSSSPFPADRLRLTTVSTVGGMVFNLTVLNLQPLESGFYKCTLLLANRPLASDSLGSPAFYVNVQGGQCNCSSYSTLLYALFAGVAVMLLLLMLVIYLVKGRTQVKPQAQVPIYEEMVGVRSPKLKLAPCGLGTFHLEEADVSDYSNSLVAKPRAENHYESPILARISQS